MASDGDTTDGLGGHGATRLDGPPEPAVAIFFTFDGRPVAARDGEPLAAAILAGGERVFRTMPDSGEPRGGFCMVGRCTDCLVVVDGTPNVRACVTPARAGMRVETQRGLGGPAAGGEGA